MLLPRGSALLASILGLTLAGCSSDDDDTAAAGSGGAGGAPPVHHVRELATNDSFVSYLAVDDARVYFQVGGTGIVAMPLAGGAVEELASNTGEALAADADALWLAAGAAGTIERVAKSGGATTVISGELQPNSIAVDAEYVYWSNRSTYMVDPPDGSIVRARKDGSERLELATGLSEPNYVAVDDAYVYFTAGFPDGAVMRVDKAGGNAVTLAANRVWPKDLTVSADRLYWFDDVDGASQGAESPILGLDKSGGEPQVLVSSPDRPAHLAVDGESLYWTTAGFGDCNTNPDYVKGDVRRTALAGGAVETLASKLAGPSYIAVDATTVYWTRSLAGCSGVLSTEK